MKEEITETTITLVIKTTKHRYKKTFTRFDDAKKWYMQMVEVIT